MAGDSRTRGIRYYNAFAKLYDLGEFFRRGTRRAVVDASGCQPGGSVLEICSGTCELALAFARDDVFTVAVDLSRDMLRIGRGKSEKTCLAFLEADAVLLPFSDDSFDAVVVSLALHHMPEEVQINVLSEMARLARSRVVALEWHAPDHPVLQTLKWLLLRLGDISEHLRAWMHQDFPCTCRDCGLTVIEEQVLT